MLPVVMGVLMAFSVLNIMLSSRPSFVEPNPMWCICGSTPFGELSPEGGASLPNSMMLLSSFSIIMLALCCSVMALIAFGRREKDCDHRCSVSVGSLLQTWHGQSETHAMLTPTRVVILQANRFSFAAGMRGATKRKYRIVLDPHLDFPCFSGGVECYNTDISSVPIPLR